MQFTLDMVYNASEEIQDAKNYPDIRVFTVMLNQSNVPLTDLVQIEESWSVPNPDSVGNKDWTYFSAVCWLYGKYLYQHLKKPIGLIASSWGGTRIETWSTKDSLSKCRNKTTSMTGFPQNDSVLWNSMIHPFINMTIYGVVWYQGEANANDPVMYNCTFPAMIDDWRDKFHQGSQGATSDMFPFGFVQLAANRNITATTGFPDLRWSQTAGFGYVPNARMKNVFMAVAMDLPDFTSPYGSIHPRDKQDVADRLVKAGLVVAYNQTGIDFQGPFPELYAYSPQANYMQIYYGQKHKKLIDVRSTTGWEICCNKNTTLCLDPKQQWFSLTVTSKQTQSVVMTWTGQCDVISALRYAWGESPCAFKKCLVYWKDSGLPAPPVWRFLEQ